jgi:arginase
MNKNRKLDIIGAQMDLGASQKGVGMGPFAVRFAGLVTGLEEMGYEVRDKGDVIPPLDGMSRRGLMHYDQVVETNRQIYEHVKASLKDGRFPIVLGGDHCVAAGSISAVAKHYAPQGEIGIIWIDAHGDWNNEKTTDTGNMHGMPFSAVCGYGPDGMVDFGQDPHFVPTAHCVQVAGHALDKPEAARMKEAGMHVFSMHDIDRMGMTEVMKEAIRIAGEGTVGIHLSFDVDAITPEYAPGTGTPVPDGLTAREAFLAVEMLAESGKLISMDLVEVNPVLDEKNKTAILGAKMIRSALGESLY